MEKSRISHTIRTSKIVHSPKAKPPNRISKVSPGLKPDTIRTETIHAGSCERMVALPDNSVDIIVTSPPYWVAPDDPGLAPAQLKERDGSTPQSAVNVATTLVDGTFYPLPYHLVPLMESLGWRMKEDLIWRRWRGWDRRGGVVIQKPYPGYFFPNRIYENILLFTKPGGPPTYADRTEAERESSRIPVDDLLLHELCNNIWNILPVQPQRRAQGADGTKHPCPYPDELAYRLITLYSYRGDIVLDPFTGSGTTLKVANLTGRRWVGYEPNPAFRKLARERIKMETTIHRHRRITRFVNLPEEGKEGKRAGQVTPHRTDPPVREKALSVKQTR